MSEMSELIYQGTGKPHDGIRLLPPPPPWRTFALWEPPRPETASYKPGHREPTPARVYQPTVEAIDMVNAALLLRRPLLVTGAPGTGKSTLAYSIAYELGLGPVLYWPITRSTTLRQGLYDYDAAGRVQDASLLAAAGAAPDIGRYVRLGPLGTALLPAQAPRVLLIDDIDNCDIDLPGDLLSVFEQGAFEIPQLARLEANQSPVSVLTADPGHSAAVDRGRVGCTHFPIVVITSNRERELPARFQRRCLGLELPQPHENELARIVAAHLGEQLANQSRQLIAEVAHLDNRPAVDQMLNAIYLTHSGLSTPLDRERIRRALLQTVEEDDW
jgi:MoxR-like ATPase